MIAGGCPNGPGEPYDPSPVGWCTTQYFTANTPFHILHTYQKPPGATVPELAKAEFRLWMDGVALKGTVYQEFSEVSGRPELVRRGTLYNFKDGLPAGTYLFYWEFWFGGTLRWQSHTQLVVT